MVSWHYGGSLTFNGEYSLIIVTKVTSSIIGMTQTCFKSSFICQFSCICGNIFFMFEQWSVNKVACILFMVWLTLTAVRAVCITALSLLLAAFAGLCGALGGGAHTNLLLNFEAVVALRISPERLSLKSTGNIF